MFNVYWNLFVPVASAAAPGPAGGPVFDAAVVAVVVHSSGRRPRGLLPLLGRVLLLGRRRRRGGRGGGAPRLVGRVRAGLLADERLERVREVVEADPPRHQTLLLRDLLPLLDLLLLGRLAVPAVNEDTI